LVKVVKGAELVKPGAMELLAAVALRLGGGDALNDGSVGEGDLKQGFVVVFDEAGGDDVEES